MMTDEITLRLAQLGDAGRAVVLLYSAYLHRQMDYPLHEEGENRFLERLQHYFRQEGNRFSYQNIEVALQGSEVVGLVLSFGGREEERLNAAIAFPLQREAHEDEWYVDALAVFTTWGHKGIGTRLLQAAEQQARQHGYTKIALNVATENEQALSLYQHLHYVVTRQTFLYHHPHVRLVKQLDNQEPIKAMLSGGNPRTLGRTEEVVALVLGDKTRLQELYDCLLEEDEIVRMRASDALEKVCRQRPAWLQPYIPQLLTEVAAIEQASVQWHLAQILGELDLTPGQRAAACRILKRNLTEKKDWIVVNYSMETLAKFSQDDAQLRSELLVILKELLSDPHKSIVARAHKLIAALSAIP